MAIARLPEGGWIETCGVSAVMVQRQTHDLWLVAITFRDGVTVRLVDHDPMTKEAAQAIADEVAGIVKKENDEHIAAQSEARRLEYLIRFLSRDEAGSPRKSEEGAS